ncbi:hypothetical protein GGR90_001670 [Sphingopyxis italica]|uniref:CobQ/CobB/MinD/ParA nucleotide binding domain-containing protein n=1 Tax=Sphingopyxis italica TaxID=1129133 RepID=A0A7X6B887_9SPHN|nr:hypothetical protein [Sphingopyxis italica]NJB89495.1 hypothetical protein [Sphingopyxis italica]
MAMLASNADFTNPRTKRRPIVSFLGDKGGTGKSFGGRAATGWFAANGYQIAAFDADGRNGHLSRYYEQSIGVTRVTLRDPLGWTSLYNHWEQADDDSVIVVDYPGNIGAEMAQEAARMKRVAAALDRDLISIWVAAEEEDSIWLLETALQVADARHTVFWMNGRFGSDPSKFELWNGSQTRARFIGNGGIEAFLPVLPIFVRTKIARARAPFHDLSSAALGLTDQIDFDLWWSAVSMQLEPLVDLLGGPA